MLPAETFDEDSTVTRVALISPAPVESEPWVDVDRDHTKDCTDIVSPRDIVDELDRTCLSVVPEVDENSFGSVPSATKITIPAGLVSLDYMGPVSTNTVDPSVGPSN